MDEASKDALKQLCHRIAGEQDTARFSRLIDDLNLLLESIDKNVYKDGHPKLRPSIEQTEAPPRATTDN